MTESELYKNLGTLTKGKDQWEENIPYVASLLLSESTKIKAKTLWLLGEMGLKFPLAIKDGVPAIAAFCDSAEPSGGVVMPPSNRIGLACFASPTMKGRAYGWPSSGLRRMSPPTPLIRTKTTCRYLRNCCTIPMTK